MKDVAAKATEAGADTNDVMLVGTRAQMASLGTELSTCHR
jgi:hypothetical protein